MITVLTWVSIFAGGILILMLLLSLIGGLDLDVDIDLGSSEVETDSGGLGVVKGLLTFISVSSWVIKVLLVSNKHVGLAVSIGIISGILAFALLNYLLKLLLRNEKNVNWSMDDALFQKGEVYLRLPAGTGSGIINVEINGAMRELKAKSNDGSEIKTGEQIHVIDIDGDYALVQKDEK